MLKTKLLGATAAAEALAIEDVFSIYFHNGTSATQTVTNGIDLAGEGGLVWIKSRTAARAHMFFDTERGVHKYLMSQSTNAEATASTSLTAFNADGFTLGSDSTGDVNYTGNGGYASWTFRKAPRFFDVVTYTGTGSARTVSHNLGLVPGCIIVKRTDTTGDWQVYHRSNTAAPETDYLVLNTTAATVDDNTRWNDTLPTSTVFSLGTNANVNASGGTYVAYLFAHDPLGPSEDGSDGLIACGSYTGTGAAGNFVDLGWEPQWVLVKVSSSSDPWVMEDNMRGMPVGGTPAVLYANSSGAEFNGAFAAIDLQPTGFSLRGTDNAINASGQTYIYIAIRRGPMREPTSGTEVFGIDTWGGGPPAFTSGFPVDWALMKTIAGGESAVFTRMLGPTKLRANLTDAEVAESDGKFDYMNGWHPSSITLSNLYSWMFRRAPGFFDVVAYTGDGVAGRTVPHNLGVAPQIIWLKSRQFSRSWTSSVPTASGISTTQRLLLNGTNEAVNQAYFPAQPTETNFTIISDPDINANGEKYIAYLFATLPGVSKVGSYTGNGSSQTINCNFTGGARFVLIKRTDSTGDWYVWDTARGIVSGNDPHLSLNTTAAEVTTNDTIDPDSSGFIVNQVSATNVNVSSASYIYLAIA